eukprot:12003402-Alexandrium_andersonii.AAC.1
MGEEAKAEAIEKDIKDAKEASDKAPSCHKLFNMAANHLQACESKAGAAGREVARLRELVVEAEKVQMERDKEREEAAKTKAAIFARYRKELEGYHEDETGVATAPHPMTTAIAELKK